MCRVLYDIAQTSQRAFFDLSPNRPRSPLSTASVFLIDGGGSARRCSIFARGLCLATLAAPPCATQTPQRALGGVCGPRASLATVCRPVGCNHRCNQIIGFVPSTHSAKWHSQCQVPIIRGGDRHKTLFRTFVFGTGSAKFHLALPVPITELTGISGDSGSRPPRLTIDEQ